MHRVADAILEEMEVFKCAMAATLPRILIVMDGIAMSELRTDPEASVEFVATSIKNISTPAQTVAIKPQQFMKYLVNAVVRGAPDMVYEGLKSCSIPEYIAYSIARRYKVCRDKV